MTEAIKWALVTGAAKRIGAGIATELHQRGLNLVLHYRHSREEIELLCRQFNRVRENSAFSVCADFSQESDFKGLVESLRSECNSLNLLVNNASEFFSSELGEVTENQWESLFGSNVKGPFFLVQALLPLLHLGQGSIVNIIDIYAQRPKKGYAVYSMAKAALGMMTLSLAKDLAPNIRVNGVAPGHILAPVDNSSELSEEEILSQIPLKRAGCVSDIAKAVSYLGLDAPYVTGEILKVDGGRSL